VPSLTLIKRLIMRNFAVTTVLTAASTTRARAVFASHGIADDEAVRWVVVTDRNLPDGSGDDLARDFKAACKRLVVLGLTGDGTTADVQTFMAAGCDAVMVKPVDIRRLARWLPRRDAAAVASASSPVVGGGAGGRSSAPAAAPARVGASALLGGSHIYGTSAMTRLSVAAPAMGHGASATGAVAGGGHGAGANGAGAGGGHGANGGSGLALRRP
jgi:CheY-like chemotaxis protein